MRRLPRTSRPLTVRTALPCLGITTRRGAAQSVYSRLLSATQERRFGLPAYASEGVATVLGGATLGSLLVYALARRVGAAPPRVGGAGGEPRTMGPERRGWRLGRRSMPLSAFDGASVSQGERTCLPLRGRAAGRESSLGVRLWSGFTAPVDAGPVDLFRALVGLLSSAYFLSAFREAELISAPEGLLDHALVRELFWYTRLSFFHPGMGLAAFRTIYALASAASLLLVIGVWIKPVSAGLFVLAVSTYRWNFPTTYVDDAIVHLMLLWVLLLPTGHTLTLPEWRAHRGAALARWKAARVPGAGVRCFLANLGLLYLVAALWKLTSPLWRDGFALYAVLKTAVSRAPEYWRPGHLRVLRVATYAALVLELLCPLALILPVHHALKWLLGVAMLGFHVGIIATMKIPFANVACIAAGVLVFRSEIMQALRRGESPPSSDEDPNTNLDISARAAALLVTLIALAMASDVLRPRWRSGTHPVVRGN
ncbi:MAG: hypothetical protein M3P51_12095, partial [Chloroflexota bacterium]|nr:hypothetical protein [Chloroflexota bacterium]